jgi:LCP family protein required for cell wall assembly
MALAVCLTALAEDEETILGDLIYATLDDEDQAEWDKWEAEALLDGDDEADALDHLFQLADDAVFIDAGELERNENLPVHVVNILLIGIDSRTDVLDIGLSDSLMILSVNLNTGSAKLTSIMRDTYVSLPGYQNGNRINTAYKFGGMAGQKSGAKDAGPKLAMRTVNRTFDMNIEYFITVNIFGLAAIIETLGGLDIELTKAEANRINFELRKEPMDKVKRASVEGRAGLHHLDGMQAVTFARIRGIDNDFVRTERQRKLLSVLMKQLLDGGMSFDRMVGLFETALPYVYTNLTTMKLFELGMAVLSSDILERAAHGEPLVSEHRVPMDKCFAYQTIDGMSVIYMNDKNLKLNKDSIHKFIYGDVYPR